MPKIDTVDAPAPETVKTAPVGLAQTNAKRLADDTRSLVTMYKSAAEEKGDKRARATTSVRTLAACVLADIERDSTLAIAARGTRVGVEIESRLRGEKTRATVSLPVLDIVRAIAFGGMVQGGGRLV